MPKITQLRIGCKEKSSNLPKTTEHISGSIEYFGHLLGITELRCGSTERLGSFPMTTEIIYGSRVW